MTWRRDLAGCAGRPPAEDRSTSRAATSHLAGRAPSVQTPGPGRAGRPPQQKPRQGPESPVPAACPKSKSIPLRPIWPVMVSSETPGPSMMVAGRARNHHTPPRNPSGRLENVVPDQDVSGRSRIPPSAPPVVDGGNTSQGVEGGSGGGIRQAMPGDVRQRARQGRHLGDPAHHFTRHHGQPFTGGGDPRERVVRQHPRSGGTAERGEWRRQSGPSGGRYRRSSLARSPARCPGKPHERFITGDRGLITAALSDHSQALSKGRCVNRIPRRARRWGRGRGR